MNTKKTIGMVALVMAIGGAIISAVAFKRQQAALAEAQQAASLKQPARALPPKGTAVAVPEDPTLPAEERKDLIEDLNEDGLSDPKHPGPEDLPLILNRIQIIQELGPYAMDQVNADAFAEAYKDLTDMLDGKPVK